MRSTGRHTMNRIDGHAAVVCRGVRRCQPHVRFSCTTSSNPRPLIYTSSNVVVPIDVHDLVCGYRRSVQDNARKGKGRRAGWVRAWSRGGRPSPSRKLLILSSLRGLIHLHTSMPPSELSATARHMRSCRECHSRPRRHPGSNRWENPLAAPSSPSPHYCTRP